jgi:hypothetical protein
MLERIPHYRLGVEVVNPPPDALDTEPVIDLSLFKPNVKLFVIAGITVSIGERLQE